MEVLHGFGKDRENESKADLSGMKNRIGLCMLCGILYTDRYFSATALHIQMQ